MVDQQCDLHTWKNAAEFIKTRNSTQVRTHVSKLKSKLNRGLRKFKDMVKRLKSYSTEQDPDCSDEESKEILTNKEKIVIAGALDDYVDMLIYSRNKRSHSFDYYERVSKSEEMPHSAEKIVSEMIRNKVPRVRRAFAIKDFMKPKWKDPKELKSILNQLIKARNFELQNCEINQSAKGRSYRTVSQRVTSCQVVMPPMQNVQAQVLYTSDNHGS